MKYVGRMIELSGTLLFVVSYGAVERLVFRLVQLGLAA